MAAEPVVNLAVLHETLKAAIDLQTYHKSLYFQPYQKQAEFFAMGAVKNQRMFNAGNRLGKTQAGAFEVTCHLTGEYPDWWPGRRFDHPVLIWALGMSALQTRDVVQEKLCGEPNIPDSLGTGLLPRSAIIATTLGRGVTGALDMVEVRHKSGGSSRLVFKSYEQGWAKMQGASVDVVWLDEEPEDMKIYTECLTRTLDRNGILFITFTPTQGETDLYVSFATSKDPSKGMVNMTADDVLADPLGHLTRESYEAMVMSWPPHEREMRRCGLPGMESGAVFPFERAQISCTPILEPQGHWRTGWAVDFGGMGGTSRKYSHPFGAVLMHYDPITDIIYVAHALQLSNQAPIDHASAMKKVCAAAPVFWPHDGHRHTGDDKTETTASAYKNEGLRMYATHATFKHGGYATETGILDMYQRFRSGRLKVAEHLTDWWQEFSSYRRDETGQIVKIHDDLMSATRIGTMMVPRFGIGVPMGSLQGKHWRDWRNTNETQFARDVDIDPFTGR